ncbi:hypothetical protein BGZ68_001949 [Mortierella alpina]|nr:hypothetical protein BGZ68_001949 [Mortierella alpina]
MRNQLVEDDVRRTLRIQSAARIHYQWTEQNRTKANIKDWRKVDWTASLGIIHDKNQPMSLHTSTADCSKRAHRIKKLHGMLPTLAVMKQRNPDLYDDDSCRRCYEQYPTQETEEHMWDCSESMETQWIGWEKACEMVNHDGNRMFNKHEKLWEMRRKKAEENNKPFTTPRPTFTSMPVKDIKESLLWIAGARDRVRSENDNDEDSDEDEDVFDPGNDWHVHDLYRGLVPKLLTTIWARMFATSNSTARYMAARFVLAIEDYMRKWIWNSRCELTVDWEKSGLTVDVKAGKFIFE